MRGRGPGQRGGKAPPLPPVRGNRSGSQASPLRPDSSPQASGNLFTPIRAPMIHAVTPSKINPLALPDELILCQDQPTIRQIADLSGFGDVLCEPCNPKPGEVGVGSVRFQYGRHFVLFIRLVRPGLKDRLHALLVPKSRGKDVADQLFAEFLADFGSSPVLETPSPLSSSNN